MNLDWLPQKFQTRRDKRKKGKYSPLFVAFLIALIMHQRGPRHIWKDQMSWLNQSGPREICTSFSGPRKADWIVSRLLSYPVRVKGLKTRANPPEPMRDVEPDQSIVQPPTQPPVPISDEQPEIELSQTAGLPRTRLASVLSDPSTDGEATAAAGLMMLMRWLPCQKVAWRCVRSGNRWRRHRGLEADLRGCKAREPHSWLADLRKEIKDHLKKKQNITFVPIEPAPYYFEFATLRLKESRNSGKVLRLPTMHEGQGNWFARRSEHSHAIIRSSKNFLSRSVVVLKITIMAAWWMGQDTNTQLAHYAENSGSDAPSPLTRPQRIIFPESKYQSFNQSVTHSSSVADQTGWCRTLVEKVFTWMAMSGKTSWISKWSFLACNCTIWNSDGQVEGPELEKIMPELEEEREDYNPVSRWVLLPCIWRSEKSMAATRRAALRKRGEAINSHFRLR